MGQSHSDTIIEIAVKQFSAKEKERYILLSDGLRTEIEILGDYYLAGQDDDNRTQRYGQILSALRKADSAVLGINSKSYPEETAAVANQFTLLHKALIGQTKQYLRHYCQAGNESAREEIYKSIVGALKTTLGVTRGPDQSLTAEDTVCPRGTCPTADGICVDCIPGGN